MYLDNTYNVKNSNIYFYNSNEAIDKDLFYVGIDSLNDSFTLHIITNILHNLNEKDVYIDIGAHVGRESIIPIKLSNSFCKVIAIEPLKYSINILKRNLSLNNINNENYLAYNVAFSKQDYQLKVTANENVDQSFSIENQHDCSKDVSLIIEIKNGDEFIRNKVNDSFKVCLIKIDVEKHESDVIIGLQNTIKYFNPLLIVEVLDNDIGVMIEKSLPIKYKYFAINEELQYLKEVQCLNRISKRSKNYLFIPESHFRKLNEKFKLNKFITLNYSN